MSEIQLYSALLLDDDPMIINSLKGALKRRGFIVGGTDDPEVFIQLVKAHRPSVVLVDLEMPRMNGIQVIGRLREIMPDIRVIVVTAWLSTYRTQVEPLKVRVVEKGSGESYLRLEAALCEELALSRQEFEALKTRKKTKLPLRILFVDDEKEIANFNRDVAIAEGMEAESVHSSQEALEKARAYQPNALCTDLMMNDLDGDELIRKMKNSPDYSFIKIYTGLTGYGEYKDRLLEAGAIEVLIKPINIKEFVEAMQRWAGLVNV